MAASQDDRLEECRKLLNRVRRRPEAFASFVRELHALLRDIYEAAARIQGKSELFTAALADRCRAEGIDQWEQLLPPGSGGGFFKDRDDPEARRVIAFWAALDETLSLT